MSKTNIFEKLLQKANSLVEYAYLLVFGQNDFKRFVIIGRSRTGSNLLVDLLNSHPNIQCYGEIFEKIPNKPCQYIWHRAFSNKKKGISAVGFKIFYYHPILYMDRKIWEILQKNRDVHVIHLKRKNRLRNLVSREIACKTDIWENNSGNSPSIEERQVQIDTGSMVKEFEKNKQWEDKTQEKYSTHPYIEVYYEDIVSNRQNEMSKILHFLSLENYSLHSDLKKQNAEHLSQLIINYQEVKGVLQNTKWKEFLD